MSTLVKANKEHDSCYIMVIELINLIDVIKDT